MQKENKTKQTKNLIPLSFPRTQNLLHETNFLGSGQMGDDGEGANCLGLIFHGSGLGEEKLWGREEGLEVAWRLERNRGKKGKKKQGQEISLPLDIKRVVCK